MSTETSKLLPTKQVCARYSVDERTIWRWGRNPKLGFPSPVIINRRKYFSEAELTAFDRSRVVRRARR